MRYVRARARQKAQDMAYRTYIADSLYCIADRGLRMTMRYSDIISDGKKKPAENKTDNMTMDEVVDKIWSKIGG